MTWHSQHNLHQDHQQGLKKGLLICVTVICAVLQLLQRESRRLQRFEALQKVSAAEKAARDEQRWRAWLARYRERLPAEADARASAAARIHALNSVNPRWGW